MGVGEGGGTATTEFDNGNFANKILLSKKRFSL